MQDFLLVGNIHLWQCGKIGNQCQQFLHVNEFLGHL